MYNPNNSVRQSQISNLKINGWLNSKCKEKGEISEIIIIIIIIIFFLQYATKGIITFMGKPF